MISSCYIEILVYWVFHIEKKEIREMQSWNTVNTFLRNRESTDKFQNLDRFQWNVRSITISQHLLLMHTFAPYHTVGNETCFGFIYHDNEYAYKFGGI